MRLARCSAEESRKRSVALPIIGYSANTATLYRVPVQSRAHCYGDAPRRSLFILNQFIISLSDSTQRSQEPPPEGGGRCLHTSALAAYVNRHYYITYIKKMLRSRLGPSCVRNCGEEKWSSRRAHAPKVAGSNPASATRLIWWVEMGLKMGRSRLEEGVQRSCSIAASAGSWVRRQLLHL